MSNQTFKYLAIFNFIIGVVLRVVIMGWLLIYFGLIEIIVRGLFLLANLFFIRNADFSNRLHRNLFIVSQLTYLLGSISAIDFGDAGGSYGLLHYWQNPPEEMIYVFIGLLTVNFIISIGIIIQGIKLKRKKRIEEVE